MFRIKLLILSCIIISIPIFNHFSYWLIPEKLAKHVYQEALCSPQTFTTRMQKYLLEPEGCIQLAKDININQDWQEKVLVLPAQLRASQVKYVHRQKLGPNIMVYYISAMPVYEDKIKVDARVLLVKTNYKWLVKSISIDSISSLKSSPAFITY